MEVVFGLIAILVLFMLGFFCGRVGTDGTLKIDHSNPRKDLYRIEIDDIYNLPKKKRVVLQVEDNADLSQE